MKNIIIGNYVIKLNISLLHDKWGLFFISHQTLIIMRTKIYFFYFKQFLKLLIIEFLLAI